jgi:hypothetical protein
MRRGAPMQPEEHRPGGDLLRSGLKGIGAVALGVVVLAAVAAVISAVIAMLV